MIWCVSGWVDNQKNLRRTGNCFQCDVLSVAQAPACHCNGVSVTKRLAQVLLLLHQQRQLMCRRSLQWAESLRPIGCCYAAPSAVCGRVISRL